MRLQHSKKIVRFFNDHTRYNSQLFLSEFDQFGIAENNKPKASDVICFLQKLIHWVAVITSARFYPYLYSNSDPCCQFSIDLDFQLTSQLIRLHHLHCISISGICNVCIVSPMQSCRYRRPWFEAQWMGSDSGNGWYLISIICIPV